MKVLHTIHVLSERSGGPSTCTKDLIEGLNIIRLLGNQEHREACSVDLLTFKCNDERDYNLGEGADWLKEIEYDGHTPMDFSQNTRKALQNSEYDLYHTNGLWMYCNHITCKVAREKNKPYVISPHGMLYLNALRRNYWKKWPLIKRWFHKDIHNADALHVMCKEEMEHCRTFGYKGPIAVIPNPVIVPKIVDSFKGNVQNLKKKRIGYLGRLHPYKRPNALIEAWAKVGISNKEKDFENWELVFMGSGTPEYEEVLKQKAHNLGLSNIKFLGQVSGDEKYHLLASLHALCCPSVSENFGMSVAEALICYTPVICTNTAPWELLETKKCGWWCDNDVDTIAEKILEAMNLDESTLADMGQRGHDAAIALCSQESVAKKILRLYEWIVSNKRNPSTKPEFVDWPQPTPVLGNKPLKVLSFTRSIGLHTGGPARSVPMLVKGLAEEGVDITLMTIRSKDMNTHALEGSSANLKVWEKGTPIGDIEKYVLDEGFNVIQLQSIWQKEYHSIAKIARKHNIPYLVTPRGMLEPWSLEQNKWKKRIALMAYQMRDMQKAACIYTTADMEALHIKELGVKAPISIIPNGIETESYPCRTSMEGVKKQILFLSRIHEKKGIEVLMQAFARIRDNRSAIRDIDEWKVVVVGNGDADYIERLKQKVKNLGLDDCFFIKDPVYGEAKVKLYQESSVFCLPSYSENFGMVIAEAMSCGVPVITTTNCPWEFINNDDNIVHNTQHTAHTISRYGWCVELSTENIKDALCEAMSMDSSELYDMGQRSSKLIYEMFNYRSVAKKTKDLFNWIITKGEEPGCIYHGKTQNLKELYFKRNTETTDNANKLKLHLWKFVDQYLFKTSLNCLSFYRVWLLRMFGAKIGKGCYISPRATITRPWDFEMGNISAIDDCCFIIPPVKIGDYVSIGNNTHLCAGGHDVHSRGFERTPKLITIEDGCFLGADSFVGLGVTIGQFSVLGAHSTTFKDIPENSIALGSPAKVHSERIPQEEYKKYRFNYIKK